MYKGIDELSRRGLGRGRGNGGRRLGLRQGPQNATGPRAQNGTCPKLTNKR